MAATATQPERTAWPREDRCPRCGERVLKARGVDDHAQDRPYMLDPEPVLPLGKCGHCCSNGGKYPGTIPAINAHGNRDEKAPRVTCQWCHGTGKTGEPLTFGLVLVDEDGRARKPRRASRPDHRRRYFKQRGRGEAAYRRHRCNPAETATQASPSRTSAAAAGIYEILAEAL